MSATRRHRCKEHSPAGEERQDEKCRVTRVAEEGAEEQCDAAHVLVLLGVEARNGERHHRLAEAVELSAGLVGADRVTICAASASSDVLWRAVARQRSSVQPSWLRHGRPVSWSHVVLIGSQSSMLACVQSQLSFHAPHHIEQFVFEPGPRRSGVHFVRQSQ